MPDIEAMKAAFLAKGGTVKIALEGEGLGLSPYEWRAKVRDPVITKKVCADSEGRAERAMEAFQDARISGCSMEAAMDEYSRR